MTETLTDAFDVAAIREAAKDPTRNYTMTARQALDLLDRLAAVEALADQWERIGALDPGQRRAADDIRAALHPDSSEAPA